MDDVVEHTPQTNTEEDQRGTGGKRTGGKRTGGKRTVSQEMRSRTQMQRLSGFFNNKVKQRTKTTPKGKNKQAGRRLEHSQHETHMTKTHERQRISTGLQTQGDYIGRQTRVTMETQLEPLKQ